MQNHHQADRLSWGDSVFLHLERDGMPLNVASVCIFEGQISLKDCVHFIESKLPSIPRYLKRVVSAPLGIGLPSWEYDPDFDIQNHIHEVRLKNGTDNELKALAGKLFSQVMDRRHPLWDMTVVRGIKGDRSGLIFRLHHCMVDGIAGVGVMNVLLDPSPTAHPPNQKRYNLQVPRPRNPLASLTGGVVDSYSDLAKRVLSGMADLLTMAERAAANGGQLLPTNELSNLLPEITAFTERLRFNVPYRGPQKFAWAEIPLSDVKTIRHTFGTSVNDVILALVTATIRRYVEKHGDPVKGRLLRIMVPVNLRGSETPHSLGNRISLVPVTIPLDIRKPGKLLAAVHRRTEFLKHSHAAELVSLAAGLIGIFPTPLQALAGPFLSQLPVTPFNLVCTNVPGPQFPLYLQGHKMLRWYPYVPVGGEMAANCAILSYNGNMYFGFSGDVHAAPDLQRMETLLQLSFRELQEACGIRPPSEKKQRARKQTKIAPKRQTARQAPKSIVKAAITTPTATITSSPATLQDQTRPVTQEAKGEPKVQLIA